MESTITAKGQTTIPKPIRQHLKLKTGDRIKYFVRADGSVVLLPKVPITALRGMLRWEGRPVTQEEMDEAVAAGATDGALPPRRE
jgi:AbrB family looped-hinge helix DNA binding protein